MIIVITKRARKIFSLLVLTAILIFGLTIFNKVDNVSSVFNSSKEETMNNYRINAIFDEESKRIMSSQIVTYINNTGENLNDIYFHIYPNAFSKPEYAPFEKSELKQAYPNGFNEGYIDVKRIANKNNILDYKIMGAKEDILEVKLDKELKPNDKIEIEIKYTVKLPNSLGRFGYGDDTINVTNWFPIACVYDERGWNTKSYEPIGDPFYSDVSNFQVDILTPKKYVLATTGSIKEKKASNEKVLYKIEANNVRDFAFILSDKFKVKSDYVGNTKISSYYLNDNMGETSLNMAKQSIKVFNKLFGKYPYNTYTVIASDFFIGGMEYPTLVMIDKTLYNDKSKFILEYIIAHETAHQWWYSTVGNDEISEPWIDEALTEYSTVLYFEQVYGNNARKELMSQMAYQSKNHSVEDIFKPTTEYKDSIDYSLGVYTKGAVIFDNIRKNVGDDVFFSTLQQYYKMYTFKNVSGDEFVQIWSKRGVDINKIISQYK